MPVALILPHKAMLGFDGGAIGADIYCDRSGISGPHRRRLRQGARRAEGRRTTAITIRATPSPPCRARRCWPTPYASHTAKGAARRSLKGLRIGIIRESMIVPKGSMTEVPIVTAAAKEIKTVLGDKLGATLVESAHPLWPRDPDIELMTVDHTRALARLAPVFMPDLFFRLKPDGTPLFPDFAATIVPTEFAPRQSIRHRHHEADRLLRRPGRRPHRSAVEFRYRRHPAAGAGQCLQVSTSTNICRAAPPTGRRKGFDETLTDFTALNARSKFWGDDQRAEFENWDRLTDMRNPLGERQGINERIMLRELLRRADMMVILRKQAGRPGPPAYAVPARHYRRRRPI